MASSSPLVTLRDALTADRATLRAAVDRVPATLRQQKPGPDRWSVAEVLEHLSIVESRSMMRVRAMIQSAPAADGSSATGPTAIDRAQFQNRAMRLTAPELIRPTGTVTADEAWAALERSRAELLAVIDTADGRDLSQVVQVHPALGGLDGYQWIGAIGAHEVRHALQIAEIGDLLQAR